MFGNIFGEKCVVEEWETFIYNSIKNSAPGGEKFSDNSMEIQRQGGGHSEIIQWKFVDNSMDIR
jgi:hypothetical protein